MGKSRITVPKETIQAFCEKYGIVEFSLFGSVLSDDFTPKSDVDVLVTLSEDYHHTAFDLVRMKEELQKIFGSAIDLVSRRGLETTRNQIRKKAILDSAETIYAARQSVSH